MTAVGAYRLEIVYPEKSPGSFSPMSSALEKPDLTDLRQIGFINSARVFVSAALQAEVEEAKEAGGLPSGTVYHCTSSKALPRIAEQKAILCSREARQIYGELETGEIAHTRTNEWPPRELDDIYAHRSISSSYFFGDSSEYPVNFGLQDVSVQDAFGDGLRLGPKVSLDAVTSVVVPHDQLTATYEWVAENCSPGTLAISQYAASLLISLPN